MFGASLLKHVPMLGDVRPNWLGIGDVQRPNRQTDGRAVLLLIELRSVVPRAREVPVLGRRHYEGGRELGVVSGLSEEG